MDYETTVDGEDTVLNIEYRGYWDKGSYIVTRWWITHIDGNRADSVQAGVIVDKLDAEDVCTKIAAWEE